MSTTTAVLPWQQPLWQQARARHAQGCLPQAILLAGPRGLGKERLARQLAALLLCESAVGTRHGTGPCGACRGCTQLAAGTHPNALLLSAEGLWCLAGPDPAAQPAAIPLWLPDKDSKKRDIGVDGIRELIQRFGLAGHYGQPKIAIVSPADALNSSGVNMLLKTIEEPSAATHVVLVAERWRQLPATLRSRCQLWRLTAPATEPALAWLRQQHPQQPEAVLARFARSPLLAAQALDPEVAEQRAQWARALTAGPSAAALPRLQGLQREDARLGLECWLELAAGWLRQRLAPHPGGPVVSEALDAGRLSILLQSVLEGLRGLERNGNPALIMESIIIRSAGAPARGEQWLDPAAHNPES